MAAASTDYILKATRRFSTTIGGAGVADGSTTTIPLTTVTGLATDTAVEITIDRISSSGTLTLANEEVIRGVVSGSNIISSVRGVEGSAQAHSAGAIVEQRLTADQWNRMCTWALVEHNQDGTHSATFVKTTGTQTISGAKTFTSTVKKPASISIQIIPGTTDITTGDGKFYFTIPPELDGSTLTAVFGQVITAGTTGTTDIQIANVTDSVDILSTKLNIESGETSSATAASQPVINTANDDMATNDLIRIDIDAVSTTAPKGLIVRLTFGF